MCEASLWIHAPLIFYGEHKYVFTSISYINTKTSQIEDFLFQGQDNEHILPSIFHGCCCHGYGKIQGPVSI